MSTESMLTPRHNRRLPSLRMVASRLGLVTAGLLMSWLLLEILLRVALPILPLTLQAIVGAVRVTPFSELPPPLEDLHTYDPLYGNVRLQDRSNRLHLSDAGEPIHVTIMNWLDPDAAMGFRVSSPDWEPHFPVDAVVVGDSFSYCSTEYADCWIDRLSTDRGLSMVNLGISGTGSVSHLHVLQNFGVRYKPRIVLWQWFGNDFNEDYGLVNSNRTPEDVASTTTGDLPPWAQWLKENSAVAATTSIAIHRVTHPVWADRNEVKDGDLHFYYGRPAVSKGFALDVPKNVEGLRLTTEAILEARDLLKAQDIGLVLVIIPTKEEVYRHWTEAGLGSEHIDKLTAGRLKMLELCHQENILCVDAYDAFTARAMDKDLLYWPADIHLNPLGNQVLSDVVWQYLLEVGLASS